MTIQMKIARTPVFLILGGMSALVLGLLASTRSLMGWALAVWGTGLLIESLGLSHHLVHPNAESRGMGTRKEKMTMAGILAVSIIPALDFLALPALLPRTAWIQDAGLILCALGVLILLRSKISWESWIGENVPLPAIRREIDSGPNHANRFLEYAGAVLWAMGICIGFGSLAGIAAAMALLIPGMLPEKPRER
jgi:protein-S-isoprenylcysteine O-methyltransferase Ste14